MGYAFLLLAPKDSNLHYRIQSRTGSEAAYSNSCVYKMFGVGAGALLPSARANSAVKLVQNLDQPRQSLGSSPPLRLLAPVYSGEPRQGVPALPVSPTSPSSSGGTSGTTDAIQLMMASRVTW